MESSRYHYRLRCRSRSIHGKDNFEGGGRASHCKVYGHSAVVYAKMVEPIEMPFGLRTRQGTIY